MDTKIYKLYLLHEWEDGEENTLPSYIVTEPSFPQSGIEDRLQKLAVEYVFGEDKDVDIHDVENLGILKIMFRYGDKEDAHGPKHELLLGKIKSIPEYYFYISYLGEVDKKTIEILQKYTRYGLLDLTENRVVDFEK